MIDLPYGYSFNGVNCVPANISAANYQSVGTCQSSGISGSTLMYNTYGGSDDDDDDSSNSKLTHREKLAIGISFAFLGGVVVTLLCMCCWFKCRKSGPLGAKEDNVNNI